MRNAINLCVAAAALALSARCEAGGFFRRVPEVGEWARYELTLVSSFGKSDDSSVTHTGALVVKCVGEETIEERRHLWIELHCEMKVSADNESHDVTKVLVPEDEMLTDTLTADDIRGWQSQNKRDPEELTFSSDELQGDTGGSALLYFNPDAPTTARMDSRTVVVNEEEIELTYSEHGLLPVREYTDDIMSGEITVWPHDDLAFGIASMEFAQRQRHVEENPNETLNEIRYDLVETGTDAVSELPDHN
jgi:hypothetical protein